MKYSKGISKGIKEYLKEQNERIATKQGKETKYITKRTPTEEIQIKYVDGVPYELYSQLVKLHTHTTPQY